MESHYLNSPSRQHHHHTVHRPYNHSVTGTTSGGRAGGGRVGGPSPKIEMIKQQPLHTQSDNDRSSELRALVDCNLTSLCDHIQSEGFNNGAFSDVIVHALGDTYHLHRLILSRRSYFRINQGSKEQ